MSVPLEDIVSGHEAGGGAADGDTSDPLAALVSTLLHILFAVLGTVHCKIRRASGEMKKRC